ncbi:head-tail connector protein [Labrys sp. 22185]|uniref:head-tail connector protein n=1 Tax=Labrys sp. 22185 TaxID=3453888 RepID=UPI003F859185
MMISLEDMKAHLNVTFDDDDALITAKIEAAQAWIESYIGAPFADAEAIPADAKEACRQLAALFYENRETSIIGNGLTMHDMPFSVQAYVLNNRAWSF